MARQKILLTALLMFSSLIAFSFTNLPVNQKPKHYKMLRYYTWGLRGEWNPDNACVKELTAKYGFTTVRKASCVVRRGQKRRYARHNKKIEQAMIKRHGQNWRDKYDQELTSCITK